MLASAGEVTKGQGPFSPAEQQPRGPSPRSVPLRGSPGGGRAAPSRLLVRRCRWRRVDGGAGQAREASAPSLPPGLFQAGNRVFPSSWGNTSDKVETHVNTKKHLALRLTGRTGNECLNWGLAMSGCLEMPLSLRVLTACPSSRCGGSQSWSQWGICPVRHLCPLKKMH